MLAVAGYHAVVCDAFILIFFLLRNRTLVENFLGSIEWMQSTSVCDFGGCIRVRRAVVKND